MEDIRELAWKGNLPALRHMVEYLGVDVNQKHAMNGTTPLHWAVNGGYSNVVVYLLSKGADPNGKDNKGVTPIDLAAKATNSIRRALGLPPLETDEESAAKDKDGLVASTAFVPLPSTPLPLPPVVDTTVQARNAVASSSAPVVATAAPSTPAAAAIISAPATFVPSTIFLKLDENEDVIEHDLPVKTFAELVYVFYNEYGLKPQEHKIGKIRKLPNILVRNDKDVARIRAGDTIQLILASASAPPQN